MFFERVVRKRAGTGKVEAEGERKRERETVRERMGEGGRMSLFRALIMNKTDSRGLVCV